MGRTPGKSLSFEEKEDLHLFLKFNERTGTALSVKEMENSIILMKMHRHGLMDDAEQLGEVELLRRIDELRPHYDSGALFRSLV